MTKRFVKMHVRGCTCPMVRAEHLLGLGLPGEAPALRYEGGLHLCDLTEWRTLPKALRCLRCEQALEN